MSVRVTAKSVGEWGKAGRVMRNLTRTVPEARLIMYDAAKDGAARIKARIERQDFDWQALAPETVRRKAAEGDDPRTLIAKGEYIDAIRVVPMGPNQWAFGIPQGLKHSGRNKDIAQIGLWHEYGTSDGHVHRRPHWRIEFRNFEQDLTRRMTAFLTIKVKGIK